MFVATRNNKIFISFSMGMCTNTSFLMTKIYNFLVQNGYQIVWHREDADIIILDSCGITDQILSQSESSLQGLISKFPSKQVLYIGCAAELGLEIVQEKATFITHQQYDKFNIIFNPTVLFQDINVDNLLFSQGVNNFGGRDDSVVKISQGCNNQCSYCNIRLAKGQLKSREIKEILVDIKRFVARNETVITLLADDCGSYGLDIGQNLPKLITEIIESNSKISLKIFQANPMFIIKYFEQLAPFIESNKIIFMTLPVQSASPRILKLMNRHYEIEDIKKILSKMRKINGKLLLATHFIVNFPSETLAEFNESIDLAVFFNYNIFQIYGNNKRTKANDYYNKFHYLPDELNLKMEKIEKSIKNNQINGVLKPIFS